MNITDTHTHLYLPEFEADGDSPAQAVRRALDVGVSRMIFPNVGADTVGPMKELHSQFPDSTFMAMGLHPTEVEENWADIYAPIAEEITSAPEGTFVAVGEIGMDLYWDKTFESQQMRLLDEQFSLAERLGLPVIIHCREALDQVLEVLGGHKSLTGVFHSFTGTAADVDRIRAHAGDFHFGINGIVTFKKSTLPAVLPEITADRLLLETDSPYLAPVPMRGKRNESAYIVHTASAVASALGLAPDTVADITTANAKRLFRL